MDHVAILNSQVLLEKIVSGEKSIESRWYMTRKAPWNVINKGDAVYFKVSGKPVTAKVTVEKVLQSELDYLKITSLLYQYGKKLCMDESEAVDLKDKKYGILVFLKNPKLVEPFNINKKGYGISSAWMYVKDINKVKEKI